MLYDYLCVDGHIVEVTQSIHDKELIECPTCGKPTERIITGGLGFRGDPRTLGTLAEQNVSKLGHYERESLYRPEMEKIEAKKERAPWWRKGTSSPNMKLNNLTPEQKRRYIEG